jgi:hypothetical protein
MAAKSVPEGHHTVTPYLTVSGAAKVIDFLQRGYPELSWEVTGSISRDSLHFWAMQGVLA